MREPLSESGSSLEEPASDEERLAPVNGGDFGDAVVGQGIGVGGAEVEEVAGLLREGVNIIVAASKTPAGKRPARGAAEERKRLRLGPGNGGKRGGGGGEGEGRRRRRRRQEE